MNDLKTYDQVHAGQGEIHFSITRMEALYARRKGAIDDPHRHNYYTVLLIIKAKGRHAIDFTDYKLGEHQVFFVAPGQVHQVVEEQASEGYVMTFSADFLIQNNISLDFISNLNLFHNYGHNPPLLPEVEQFTTLLHYAEEISKLYQNNQPMSMLSIGAYVKLMLILCNNICTLDPLEAAKNSARNHIIRQFKEAVDKHYRKEHGSSFYASLLHISPDHLNRSVKGSLGSTAKEYIQTRIAIEAKRLLCFSELSTKEIAFNLGFSEPGNFSAFFKKMVKQSPSQFRKHVQKD